ncbi:unnamed protein product [Ostreobium quekettii]|uniref:Uncharacterized protein n=1 Tax=Ostreobium quekettii TaxID=121088 RepID=A0A8S1J5E5_9CHLO|nr:unnamed protein product [Ostreobium quekettii]
MLWGSSVVALMSNQHCVDGCHVAGVRNSCQCLYCCRCCCHTSLHTLAGTLRSRLHNACGTKKVTGNALPDGWESCHASPMSMQPSVPLQHGSEQIPLLLWHPLQAFTIAALGGAALVSYAEDEAAKLQQ